MIHRAIHWPPLYKNAHRLHHYNVDPGLWSGLAMHPVEHLFYFSYVLIFFVVPFHPFHLLFMLVHTALVPAQVPTGFGKLVVDGDRLLDFDDYSHYLHQKYFECDYSDCALPLDRWFNTLHDGSEESEKAMLARFKAKNAAKS